MKRWLGIVALAGMVILGWTSPAQAAASTSARGSTIVFQVSSGSAIYTVRTDGTGLRYLTTGMDPALSPDGRTVAFTRWDGSQDGASGSLWMINADGSGLRQILSSVNQPKSPTWSRDGNSIVVSVQEGGTLTDTYQCLVRGKWKGNLAQPVPGARCLPVRANPQWGLKQVTVSTGAVLDLPHAAHSFGPAFDPANPWRVVYHGDTGLVALDLNSGKSWALTNDSGDHTPAFSPDGSKIATSYWQSDHWEIHLLNADGSGAVRLTETPLTWLVDQQIQGVDAKQWNNAAPAWSPDGSQIAFVTDRSGQWEIWVMNADGSGQHVLVPAMALPAPLQYNGVDERVISWR
jgi:Tol biopolymer transport system component